MEPTIPPTTLLINSCLASVLASHQHYLWKNQLGFLIHPKTELNADPTALKIAEIGTKNGVWLLDLAKKLPPTTTLEGYGMDTSSAPPPRCLPANVSIHKVSSYSTPFPDPPRMQENYDIIHITSIADSIEDNNPGPVIQNAMAMLKPNGSLQWSEPDTATTTTTTTSPHHPLRPAAFPSSPNLSALLSRAGGPRGWIDSLPDILARYGLRVPAGRHRWRLPDAYARVGTDAWLLGLWLAVARGVALDEGKGGDGEGEEEEEEEGEGRWALVKKAGEECAAGVRVEMVVAVGRKGGLV